jgi:hypothetical protein
VLLLALLAPAQHLPLLLLLLVPCGVLEVR